MALVMMHECIVIDDFRVQFFVLKIPETIAASHDAMCPLAF